MSFFPSRRFDSETDIPFAKALHATTIAADVAMLPEPLRTILLGQQYDHWVVGLRGYPALEDRVLLDATGAPTGRLVLSRSDQVLTVVDIGLLPEQRNRGRGEAVMREVFEAARTEGRVVEGVTRVTNPARRLYDRIGMVVTAEDELLVHYRYSP